MVDEVLDRAVRTREIEVALLHQHLHLRIAHHRVREIDSRVGDRHRLLAAWRTVPVVPLLVQPSRQQVLAVGLHVAV